MDTHKHVHVKKTACIYDQLKKGNFPNYYCLEIQIRFKHSTLMEEERRMESMDERRNRRERVTDSQPKNF